MFAMTIRHGDFFAIRSVVLAALCLLALGTTPCFSQGIRIASATTSSEVVLGNPKLGRTDGLKVRVFPPQPSCPGYYRWTFEVFRADGKAFPADQEIEVAIEQSGNLRSYDSRTVEKVLLAQGKSKATKSVLFPTWRQYSYWIIYVSRDGRELSGFSNEGWHWTNWENRYGQKTLLIVEDGSSYARYLSEFPGQLATEFRSLEDNPHWSLPLRGWSRLEPSSYANNQSNSELAISSRLPSNWLEYTPFRWIWIQRKCLDRIQVEQLAALRDYAAGGGVVVITQTKPENLEKIRDFFPTADDDTTSDIQNLGFQSSTIDDGKATSRSLWQQWIQAQPSIGSIGNGTQTNTGVNGLQSKLVLNPTTGMMEEVPIEDAYELEQWLDHPIRELMSVGEVLGITWLDSQLFLIESFAEANKWRKSTSPKWTAAWSKKSLDQTQIMTRPYGMGMVVATDIDRLSTLPQKATTQISLSVGNRINFEMRGVDLALGAGENFWNWMIPEVGRPPVWSFMGIIILFAAITGPGLMWFTYRTHRQSWLLLLFPIIALCMTTILFGFAIFHDGFETYSRIRSYTWYDAASKRGFAWSRQTYFSGMPPSAGFHFGPKTEVTPFQPSRQNAREQALRITHTTAADGGQNYQRILTPREQRQILVRHPVSDLSLFDFQGVDESGQPKMTNTSGSTWKLAVFTDRTGNVWQAENVEDSKLVALSKTNTPQATAELAKLNRNSGLELPPGFVRGQQLSIFDWMSNRYAGAWTNTGMAPLMETEMSRIMLSADATQPGTYVIVIENPTHIERPTAVDRTSTGFHVVGGAW
jgi:hypothetical protein